MRKFVIVGVAVALLVGVFIYFQQSGKRDSEKADQEMAQFEAETHAASRAMQADIDESNARLITLKLGKVAGLEYRRCKISPPKLKENQDKCLQFDEFLKKQDAEEKQHPSW